MNKKTKTILIFSAIILVVLVVAGIAYYSSTKDISYFYDNDVGLITITVSHVNWLTNIFTMFENKQTSFDPWGTQDLGTSVQLRNQFSISTESNPVAYLRIVISKDGSDYKTIDKYLLPQIQPGGFLNVNVAWTPTSTGTYRLSTYIKCDTAAFGKTCSGNWFKVSDPLESQAYGELKIRNPTQSCSKSPYCSDYEMSTPITGGSIYVRTCYKVSSDCEYITDSTSYETRCSTGYVISGSTDTVQPGQKECVLPVVETDCVANPSLCVSPQVCKTEIKTCVDPECNTDRTTQCPDGTNIITHSCIYGFFVATNNECPIVTNCVTNPSTCIAPQVCNANTKLCEDAAVSCNVNQTLVNGLCIDNGVIPVKCYFYQTQDGAGCKTSGMAYGAVAVATIVILSIVYLKFRRKR